MDERVVFYQLTHKFVDQTRETPQQARQVVYFTLAIGHHIGVMDCFQALLEMPLDDYRRWVALLPHGSARRKLEGLLKWGEIEINHDHAAGLLAALMDSLPEMNAAQASWAGVLSHCLRSMAEEPALYLMVRKRI
jgi:hypothetical protein